jgi:hypothetical protein
MGLEEERLRNVIKTDITGTGCTAYMSSTQCRADNNGLFTDGHRKYCWQDMYQHFTVYTVRVQTIKDVYEFVDVGHKDILGSKEQLCLSLMPVVRGIVVVDPAVALYYLLNGNCSTRVQVFVLYVIESCAFLSLFMTDVLVLYFCSPMFL